MEKTGAEKFTIHELFDYVSEDTKGAASGVVFLAEIETLGQLPESFEMAERKLFDQLPDETDIWTYPAITPELIAKLREMGYH